MLKLSLFLVIFIFIVSCDNNNKDFSSKVEVDSLETAKEEYYSKNYDKSALMFASIVEKSEGIKKSEANLGYILSALGGADKSLQQVIDLWSIENVYYWNGRTFDPLATVSQNYAKIFVNEVSHYKFFHIIDILIEQGNDTALQQFLNIYNTEKNHKFVLAKAWYALCNGYYYEAQRIFAIINSKQKEVLNNVLIGLSLSQVLQNNLVPESSITIDNGVYFIDTQKIVFNQNTKQLNIREDLLNAPTKEVLIADMLFHLGTIAKHSFNIWTHGIHFLQQHQKFFPDDLYQDYFELFSISIAWQNFLKGDLAKAKKSFADITKNKKNLPRFYEASLAQAIIFWMEEEDIEELLEYQQGWLQNEVYWLGGRPVSLFGTTRSKENWKEYMETEHLFYLNILDALCRLGEGRSAYLLYGEIINSFSDKKLLSLYEKEEKNIPKDVYAENKIWEKID